METNKRAFPVINMTPSEAIQYCLDEFSKNMWSDKREAVYKALSEAKRVEGNSPKIATIAISEAVRAEIKKAIIWTLGTCDIPRSGSIDDYVNSYFDK